LLVGMLAYSAARASRGLSSPSDDERVTPAEASPGAGRTSLLEVLSMLAVGVLIAFFVGFGIQAFYPAPEPPENPTTGMVKGPEDLSPEQEAQEEEFARQMRTYREEELPAYDRTASLVAVGIAVLILTAVLLLRRLRIRAIRDGVALGGVLALLYGLVLALQSEGDVFRFLMVAVVLLVVLVTVFLRFRTGRDGSGSAG
jgi:hypothetical protein